MKKKAIFLDRDGVLNEAVVKNGKPYPPESLADLSIPHDVSHALSLLKQSGFLLIGATNQPDVARGKTAKSEVEKIHSHLIQTLPLDDILVCYHDDSDKCFCRKPLPGLLTQAASAHNIDLQKSYMIGDRWKDIEAGRLAGCQTIWLDYAYHEDYLAEKPHFIASTLSDAAQWIINNRRQEG